MTNKITREQIQKVYETEGYKAANALADRAGIVWFASTGAARHAHNWESADKHGLIDRCSICGEERA